MLVTYALENRSRWFILAFSVACLLGSVYGFCRERGRLDWSKESGRWWRCDVGGWQGNRLNAG